MSYMNRTADEDRRRSQVDRRGARRHPFVAAVRASLGQGVSLGQAANLGMTGMLVQRTWGPTEETWPQNTVMRLRFELPDGGDLLELAGEVVFDRPGGRCFTTGVRFGEMPVEAAARLRSFLED